MRYTGFSGLSWGRAKTPLFVVANILETWFSKRTALFATVRSLCLEGPRYMGRE